MISEPILSRDGNMRVDIKTPPTKEPVAIGEFKTFARIDGSEEDTFLDTLIKSARDAVERYLGKALIEQTIVASLDYWPTNDLILPRPPLSSVTQIRTVDEDGTATEYSTTNYYVMTHEFTPKVVLRMDATPPTNTERAKGGIEVEYVAGYGSTGSYVPGALRLAIMNWALVGYETRSMPDDPPEQIKKAIDRYRLVNI